MICIHARKYWLVNLGLKISQKGKSIHSMQVVIATQLKYVEEG